jgi:hypothetical protein
VPIPPVIGSADPAFPCGSWGDETCHFQHDYPAGYSVAPDARGEAVFLVGPADTPGWYMTVFQGCG